MTACVKRVMSVKLCGVALGSSATPWDLARVGAALRAPSQPPWALPPGDICCASPIAMTFAFLLLLAQSLSGRRG